MKKLILATLLAAAGSLMCILAGVVPDAVAAPLEKDMVTLSVRMIADLSAEEQSAVISRNGGKEKYDLKSSRALEAALAAISRRIEKLEAEQAAKGRLLDNARDAHGLLTEASIKARLAVVKKQNSVNAEYNLLQAYLHLLELKAAAINKAKVADTLFTEPYVKLADTLRIHLVTVPATRLPLVLQDYQADPQVESVEVVKTRRAEGFPSDSDYGVQWALSKIGWESVFGTVTPAGTARVALLDMGVEAGHSDLGDNVIAGVSILDGSFGMTDPSGHGTRLAGIIAAVTDNSRGIAAVGYSGVKIMPVTVLNGAGEGQDHDIIAGIVWAADNGADVILMAFSSPDYSQHLQDAIDYAWAKGAVLVAATGNGSLMTPTFPSGNRGVIGVSATDQNDLLAPFSNTGLNVFLAAPGTDIYTTNLVNSYNYISGTSASAAIVAGVAAFMKAVDPSLTNGVIVDRLGDTADMVGDSADPDYLYKYGHGRVNMANALNDSTTDVTNPPGVGGSGGVSGGTYQAAAAFTQSAAGTYPWTAPANVTQIVVRLWGGGGAGGGSKYNKPAKGGGGAGGQFAESTVTVVPGSSYTIVVGDGGLGSVNDGTIGGDSTFATTTVVAKGGGRRGWCCK
jgi:subtilisin family serine protease